MYYIPTQPPAHPYRLLKRVCQLSLKTAWCKYTVPVLCVKSPVLLSCCEAFVLMAHKWWNFFTSRTTCNACHDHAQTNCFGFESKVIWWAVWFLSFDLFVLWKICMCIIINLAPILIELYSLPMSFVLFVHTHVDHVLFKAPWILLCFKNTMLTMLVTHVNRGLVKHDYAPTFRCFNAFAQVEFFNILDAIHRHACSPLVLSSLMATKWIQHILKLI